MSATIQPKGNKLYVVVDVHDENGKRKQKWISTGLDINGNKRKAEEIRKEIEREYEIKNRLVPSEAYLDEFTQRWINTVRSDVDVITYGGYENIVRAHIIPYFKKHKVKVNEVTPDIMQAYFDEMKTRGNKNTGKGLSPKSLRSHLNVFRQIFKLARKEKIIFDDPSEFVKLPKNTPQKVEVYDSETLKKVFEAIKDDRLFHLIYVTLFFGMRRSEALGIRWDAVDFENKTLTVKHTDNNTNVTVSGSTPLLHTTERLLRRIQQKRIQATEPIRCPMKWFRCFVGLKAVRKRRGSFAVRTTLKMIMFSNGRTESLLNPIMCQSISRNF